MARAPRKDSEWRPWGFYDHEPIPEIPESAFSAAMKLLKIEDAQRADFATDLQGVAITYWQMRRDVESPAPKWYRQQIQPIREATTKLLRILQKPAEGTGRAALARLTKLRMERALRGSSYSDRESVEQLLENFIAVCDECLRQKGSAGARKQKHVQEAATELLAIWENTLSKRPGLSLTIHQGEFTYPAPRFVQIVLQAIDPEVSTSEIATALRNALGKKRVQKSARR